MKLEGIVARIVNGPTGMIDEESLKLYYFTELILDTNGVMSSHTLFHKNRRAAEEVRVGTLVEIGWTR